MTDGPVHQEILFVDDFTHQNSDTHWDHIKFNQPVYIEQIRVIPQNCSIQLGNGLLHRGSTLPNKFRIEFYSNNLSKKDQECCTLDKFGTLNYDDSCPNDSLNSYTLKPSSVPIDWLVIAGSYLSLSLAIVGVRQNLVIQQPLLPSPNLVALTRTISNRLPVRHNFQARHHPYTKPVQHTIKIEPDIKQEPLETSKIEPEELFEDNQDESDEILESSIVKFYLKLDESKDELDIIGQISFKNENLNCLHDPFEFRLDKKERIKGVAVVQNFELSLQFLVDNLNEEILEYLKNFRDEIHLNFKSNDIKFHNIVTSLCKNLNENYSHYLIDEILELSPIVVDCIIDNLNNEFYNHVSKLVNLLNCVLNSAKSMEKFIQNDYKRFIKHFQHRKPLGSRLTYSIGKLLLKIQFYENLKLLNDTKDPFESILVYIYDNLRVDMTPMNPVKSVFTQKYKLNFEIFNYLEQTQFFKNCLILWSCGCKDLIDKFFQEFFLPSTSNINSFYGLEYLLEHPEVTNCIFKICLGCQNNYSNVVLKINHSVYLLNLIDQLIQNFESLKQDKRDLKIFTLVNLIQEIDFCLSTKNDMFQFLVDLMSKSDGNFNNKYFKALVDIFEYLIDDNLDGDLRCFALNSITNILSTLCLYNQNWSVTDPKEFTHIKKLNRLSSNLINNLIMTSLKPSAERNQSYFKLIDKLKKIMSILDPFFSFKDGEKNFLNFIIDSFREQIDKNLNIYIQKYAQNSSQCLNYLNSNITQLTLLRNLLKSNDPNDKMNIKIQLGNLINRNLYHVLVNFLIRMSDYVKFYRSKCDLKKSRKISQLVEPSVWLIKVIVLNLFNVQKHKFDDFYVTENLLEFYTVLDQVNSDKLVEHNLMEVFSSYAKFRPVKFFDHLSKFCVKKPENFVYSLKIFSECLKYSKHIDLKPLLNEDVHKYLIKDSDCKHSNFVSMLRLMSLSVGVKSLFMEICDKMLTMDFVRVFVDYSMELFVEIKSNFSLNEVEDKKEEPLIKDDLLYDTNLVELPLEDDKDIAQDNLNEYKLLLIQKFILLKKFLVNFINSKWKHYLVDLGKTHTKVTNEFVSSVPNYTDYIPSLLRYFNQVDFNLKQSKCLSELSRVQEGILDLVFYLLDDIDESLLAKVLIDHIGMTKFDNLQVTVKCLNCLIHFKNRTELLNNHFKNVNYLINYVNELAGKLKNFTLGDACSILNKSFNYIKILINHLIDSNEKNKISILLEWTVKNSNDSLIDSISMSSSCVLNGSLQHCLINLDKNIENYFNILTDDESKKKFKIFLNYSSCLLKFLNELDPFGKNLTFYGEVKNECEDSGVMDEMLFEINFDLIEPVEMILMTDKELYKKLKSCSEEYQILDDTEDKSRVLKTPDVINTRTGVRYKAPMRGGHSNSTSRVLTNSTSVPSISLLTNSTPSNPLIRTDSFRTRPQNTSRPPSLHVDDFYRIEQQQKQMNTSLPETNGSSDSLNQMTRNNSITELNYPSFQEELTVQTSDQGFVSAGGEVKNNMVQNISVISPQVKQMMNGGIVNNGQSTGQFISPIGQSLLKTPPIPSQFNNMNSNRPILGMPYGGANNDMNNRQQYSYNGNQCDMNNGQLYSQNMNDNLIHPSQISPNQSHMMNNQNNNQIQPQQQQQQQISSMMMQNQMFNSNFRYGQPNQVRGGLQNQMFRGGMRRGVTIPNMNQLNQNFMNGSNFVRPPYQSQNQYQQHQHPR